MALTPQISREFNGIIWRIEIDPITNTLFTEVRNEAKKQVSFASVNLAAGKVNFNNLTTAERWLTGMEAAFNGVLLLHHYQSAGSPIHKGIIAIDAESGGELWADYNCTFHHISINGPVCFDNRIQPRKLFVADIKTGSSHRPYHPAIDEDVDTGIILPDLVNADLLDDSDAIRQHAGNIAHKLNYKGYRIVSLHALNAGVLNQHLYIFKGEQQVFSDILNAGIQKLQPEAFVLHKQYLIYLKNRVELNVIDLEN